MYVTRWFSRDKNIKAPLLHTNTQFHTFVSLIRHFTTRSENFWFLVANDSLDAGEGHLEGSKGLNKLISTTKDDVRSALSCSSRQQIELNKENKIEKKKRNETMKKILTRILSINTFNAFNNWLPSSIKGTLSSKSHSSSSVMRLSRVLSLTARASLLIWKVCRMIQLYYTCG